jgi:hypothetical protein
MTEKVPLLAGLPAIRVFVLAAVVADALSHRLPLSFSSDRDALAEEGARAHPRPGRTFVLFRQKNEGLTRLWRVPCKLVGVTAGASTPDYVIDEVEARIAELTGERC